MRSLNLIFGTVVALILMMPMCIYCQTETFDIVTYTPPKGWTKTVKEGAVAYADLNKTASTYCVVTVYKGMASSGDAGKDFAIQWKTRVSDLFKTDADPKTETQSGDGWTIKTAVTLIDVDGVRSLAMLTGFSGYGKSASILVISNSETYTKAVTDFLEGVKLDKTPVALQAPPILSGTPSANSYDPAALVGRWGNGIAGDTISGNTITYGSNATQQYYKFNADGTYEYVYSGYSGLAGQAGSFHITTNESGIYTIRGDSITITPKRSQTKTSNEGLRNDPLETVTYRWTIHYFEGVKEYSLVLHPDKQTKRDGGFSYGCMAFPNSYCYSQMK